MRAKKDSNIEIGQNVKEVRELANMTQDQFSEHLSLGVKHISAIERGAVGLSIDSLRHMCKTLNIPADRILFGFDDSITDRELELLIERLRKLSGDDLEISKAILNQLFEYFSKKSEN